MSQILRRDVLRSLIAGPTGWALRSAATGLPVAFLMNPQALAEEVIAVDPAKAQFAVMALSDAGEPINTNCPGSYDFADMVHPPMGGPNADNFEKAPILLGGKQYTAAKLWTTLPQWVLDRSMFLQHATYVDNHGMIANVMRLMGRTKALEMIPAIYARHLAGALKTVQSTPISAGSDDILTAGGIRIPNTPPTAWRELVGQYEGMPSAMQNLRDDTMNDLYRVLRQRGTPAQLRYLDRLARSGSDAKKLGGDVGNLLANITNNEADGQLQAAVAIIKMNLSPVVAVRLNFGGDNHNDPQLSLSEGPRHIEAMAALVKFFAALKLNGLEDKVTFVSFGVFGRNFRPDLSKGRDHWGNHHTTVVIGKNVRGGIIGGTAPRNNDYIATSIDSITGAGIADGSGDIKFEDTLAAAGKTIGAALGITPATLDQEISGGKVVVGALT